MMNSYLSRHEKSNFVRLSACLGLANEIVGEYEKSKNPDRDFMRYLKTGMTWLLKAVNRRKEFLDQDAALDFAKQCSRLEPIIFVPNDKARKEFEDIRKIQNMIVMSREDFEDWYGMVIPYTCEKCDGKKCKDTCKLRIMLAKYGAYPVNPEAVDTCQYSYADSDVSEIKQPLQQDDISPEDKAAADAALQEVVAGAANPVVENVPNDEMTVPNPVVPDEPENDTEFCSTLIQMDSGRDIDIELPKAAAENLCKVFNAHLRPVYAYFHDGDIFEVDLAKAEAVRCNGVGEIVLQENHKPTVRQDERDFTKKKNVHIRCKSCDAEYDDQVPEFFTRVKCRECGRWIYFNDLDPEPEHKHKRQDDFKDPVNLFGGDADERD